MHLKGFEALGVKIEQGHGYIEASAPEGMTQPIFYLDFPSVGATENIMMAAAMANGTTVLENTGEKPEIVDLADYLNQMGARVRGAVKRTLLPLKAYPNCTACSIPLFPTALRQAYMIAAMTGGDVILKRTAKHGSQCRNCARPVRWLKKISTVST